jgi:hypothetical protein
MLGAVSVGNLAVGALCAVAAVVTLIWWIATKPRVFAVEGSPPVVRRAAYWLLGIVSVFEIAAVAWVVLRTPLGLPLRGAYSIVPLALALLPLLVVNPLYLWHTASVRRSLAASGGRLCTHCAYDVSGLEPAGVCPECGKPYNIDTDGILWKALETRTKAAPTADAPPPDRCGPAQR